MFTGMLHFEWRYHTHRWTFALVALVVAFMAFALVQTGYAARVTHVNSPYTVMESFGLLSLWTLFTQTIFCVNGALRDDEHGMHELVHSRPVGRARHLAVRYLGIVLVGVAVMILAGVVLMTAPLVLPIDADSLGTTQPLAYVWALMTLIVPDIILVSALLFAVAALARSTLATYVGGIAIFALYTVVAMLTDSPLMAGSRPPSPEGIARAALLDPFGLAAVFEQTRYWPPEERNVRLISLSGNFLLNRVLWLAVSAAVLVLTYRFASLGATGAKRARYRRRESTRLFRDLSTPTAVRVRVPVMATQSRRQAFVSGLASATRMELKLVINAWTFRALMLLWMFIYGVEAASSLVSGEYGTHLLATSGLLVADLGQPLLLVGTLCLIYFGAEVAWRERMIAFDTLIDATPASNGVFYVSKLLALCAIPILLTALGVLVAIALQLASRGLAIDPVVYLAQFWFAGFPLVLFGVAVMTLQVVTGNRWTGMMASILLAIVSLGGAATGLEHPMLRFGAAPPISYSDLDRFGPAALSFSAFMLYWVSCAVLMVIVSWTAWRRGRDAGVWWRLAAMWRLPQAGARRALLVASVVFAVVATLLLRETNVAHAWVSTESRANWSADYERAYRRLTGRPQPSIVSVDVAVDFDPPRRSATVRGTLVLKNRTSSPIDTVWVQVRRDIERASVSMDGAREVGNDERFRLHVLVPTRPLQPGDSATMRYECVIDRGGVRAGDFDRDVASNGSFLTAIAILPVFGYRAGYELSNPSERRKHGLGEATSDSLSASVLDSLERETRRAGSALSWITLHAVLSSTDGQTPLGPGRLVRKWVEGNRRFAEYRVDSLAPGIFAFAVGHFDVKRVQHGAVPMEFWYHPAHAGNVDRMMAAAARTLDVLEAQLGPYPRETLRMVEVPSGWPFGAFATPGMMFFTENRGLLSDPRRDDVDLLTRRVAHEVAHQWWGHSVSPLSAPGATVIVETLAKYAEQRVIAAVHGEDAVTAMLAFDHDRYLAGRGTDATAEPTLLTAGDQQHIYYGKGALAMQAMRDALGDPAVTSALARLYAREHGPFGAATATKLYGLLRAEARSDDVRVLVDEWFTDRVLYDLRADSAVARREAGAYGVYAEFTVGRTVVQGRAEVPTSADGALMDVVVYGADGATVLHRDRVRVSNGRAVLSLAVRAVPGTVEIDPGMLRIDRDRSNNRIAITLTRP
jgi:hypothetical protein